MKKRLLFVYYQNIKAGGVAKVLANLVNELVNHGYEIDILFLMAEHEDFYPIDNRVKKHYIDSFSYWTWSLCVFNKKRLGFIPKIQAVNNYIYQFGVSQIMNKWFRKNHNNYDTIVSCWYKLSCTLAINKRVANKTIAWEHTSHKVGGVFFNNLKRHYKKLNSIVCLNNDDYSYYKSINLNSFIIGNIMDKGFDSQFFIPHHDKEDLITMIARLDEDKNVLEFLKIIKKADLSANWKINIIGDGVQMQVLKEYVKKHNLKGVFFLGELTSTEVKGFLSKSKISCLTSKREGFGVVLIEAMFSSNVLIAYDCPSGPSEILNDKNGFLINLGNRSGFVDKLKKLTNNNSLLNNLMISSYENSKKWKKDILINNWKEIL